MVPTEAQARQPVRIHRLDGISTSGAGHVVSAGNSSLRVISELDYPLRSQLSVESANELWLGEVQSSIRSESGFELALEVHHVLLDVAGVDRLASHFHRPNGSHSRENDPLLA